GGQIPCLPSRALQWESALRSVSYGWLWPHIWAQCCSLASCFVRLRIRFLRFERLSRFLGVAIWPTWQRAFGSLDERRLKDTSSLHEPLPSRLFSIRKTC